MKRKKKLSESRIIRLALYGIMIVLLIKLISMGMVAWIIRLIEKESDSVKIESFSKIVEILSGSIYGSIATIISAVAVRYGAREATLNLSQNHSQSEYTENDNDGIR